MSRKLSYTRVPVVYVYVFMGTVMKNGLQPLTDDFLIHTGVMGKPS
jgi:hypothetical protein